MRVRERGGRGVDERAGVVERQMEERRGEERGRQRRIDGRRRREGGRKCIAVVQLSAV